MIKEKTKERAKRFYKKTDAVADYALDKIKVSYATPVILLVIVLTLVGFPLWFFYG